MTRVFIPLLIFSFLHLSLQADKQPEQLTYNGHVCVFPFTFEGRQVSECLPYKTNSKDTWCAIEQADYDKYKKWDYCYTKKDFAPVYTKGAKQCVLPFRYKGALHTSCVTEGDKRPWCAVGDPNYDKAKEWDYCVFYEKVITKSSKQCIFPFLYKGYPTTRCVKGAMGNSWCAVEHQNFDHYGKYDNCPPHATDVDTVPTVRGYTCKFPYLHAGKAENKCRRTPSGRLWCAISYADFDTYGYWDYCKPGTVTVSGEACKLPFKYRGTMHHKCIPGARPWCAIRHADYDKHLLWDYCYTKKASVNLLTQ